MKKKTEKKATRVPLNNTPMSYDDGLHNILKAQTSESGSDMIRNYGKIDMVIEMYESGPMRPEQALKRIIEIVKGVRV